MTESPPLDDVEIISLADSKCQDRRLVGGKAATLARLYAVIPEIVPLGLALPPGSALEVVDPSGNRTSDEVRRWFASLLNELSEQSDMLLVVRSSAVEEDSEANSYAGQYDSTLGCRSIEDVLDGIRNTLQSGVSARVTAYARAVGTTHSNHPAVLIQRMISADRSGVAFTRNPITSEKQVIINASYGLGDTIVDGSISPDEVVVGTGEVIIHGKVGTKQVMSLVTPSGLKRVSVPDSLRQVLALSDNQVRAVADAALRCEDILGYAVDVEWAISGASLYVVQARPITTLRAGARVEE